MKEATPRPDASRCRCGQPVEWRLETERLATLDSYAILGVDDEPALDGLTRLAAQVCQAPVALIVLVGADRAWVKSRFGADFSGGPRRQSLCAHLLGHDEVLVVPDLEADDHAASRAAMAGGARHRFYAGAPLRTEGGHVLGALCVFDQVRRTLTDLQTEQLADLARLAMGQLELRRQAAELEREADARREADAELARGRRLLTSVLDHCGAAVHVKDLQGRYVLVNQTVARIAGRRPEEIVGRTFREVYSTEQPRSYADADQAVALSGGNMTFSEKVIGVDGVVCDFLTTKFALRDERGQIYAVAGVSTDVTRLEQQRRELTESEQRWRSLVEHSPVPVAVIGADHRYLYVNPQTVRLYAAGDEADLVGKVTDGFVPPEDLPGIRAQFMRVVAGETVTGTPLRLVRVDGVVIDVEVNAAPVEYQGQSAVQVELRDISAQVATETRLRESERRWRSLFANSPVGICVITEQGEFVHANAAMCDILGRDESQVLGRRTADFTPSDDPTLVRHGGQIAWDSVEDYTTLEKRYLRPDGEVRWVLLSITKMSGPEAEHWSLGYVQDITARKAAEQAIAESEANLSASAAVIRKIQSGADARRTIVQAGVRLARASTVTLLERLCDAPMLQVTCATRPELVGLRVPLAASASVGVDAYLTGEPTLSDTPITLGLAAGPGEPTRTYSVPVRVGGVTSGVLVVDWDRQTSRVDDRSASLVRMLADQAGMALRQENLVAELERLALTDALTTLPNRRSWDQRLDLLLDQVRRSGRPLTVALADLDHFKQFNDAHGHLAGDDLLKAFATEARHALRSGDAVARWGGEEFAFALPDCTADEASWVLNRVRHAVPRQQSCSIGYATFDGVETAGQLMLRADRALYAAKESGRDRIAAAT